MENFRQSSSKLHSRHSGNRSQVQESRFREQGTVHTLLDGFGFIYSASRPCDVFFHYSEVKGMHSDDLKCGDEVEFWVGPRRQRRGQRKNEGDEQLSAYDVQLLAPGTIQWEEAVDAEGIRRRGIVEKAIKWKHQRADRKNALLSEGRIRVLPLDIEEGDSGDSENLKDEATVKLYANFLPDDYKGENEKHKILERNDIVELTLVKEKRSGNLFARDISLIQSERQKLLEKQEAEMLAKATLEQGIIVSLKNGYGFIKSSRRKEEVYFHFSHIEIPINTNDEGGKEGEENHDMLASSESLEKVQEELKANSAEYTVSLNQEVEFLVITDQGGKRNGKKKLAARKINFLPKGTVEFEKTHAMGVKGTVVSLPRQSFSSRNGSSENKGRVKLCTPIMLDSDRGNLDSETTTVFEIKTVDLTLNDCRGFLRDLRESDSWLKVGDEVCFDVIEDFVDGSFRAGPTKFISVNDELVEDNNYAPCIRLMSCSLIGRAEGTIASLKRDYGFIRLAHRNVDVYFRIGEVVPSSICLNPEMKSNLEVGDEVSFDLSLQVPASSGRQEREQLRAQRLIILEPGSLTLTKIDKDVTGVVAKTRGGLVGQITLDKKVKALAKSKMYPLIMKLLQNFEEDTTEKILNFAEVQSENENKIFADIIHERDGLELNFIPDSNFVGSSQGRISIKKVEREVEIKSNDNASSENNAEEENDAECGGNDLEKEEDEEDVDETEDPSSDIPQPVTRSSKRNRKKKVRSIKSILYTKTSLSPELLSNPLGNGDKVSLTITFMRNTGQFVASDITLVEKCQQQQKEAESSTKNVGLLLLEPYKSLEDSSKSRRRGFEGGRWDIKQERSFNVDGIILLLEDKSETRTDQSASDEKSTHLSYTISGLSRESEVPKRGDKVSFVTGKNGVAKDIRVVEKNCAQYVNGSLMDLDTDENRAVFVVANDGNGEKKSYNISLSEVVGCDVKLLKEETALEGFLVNGMVVGLCRITDLYLTSTSTPSKGTAKVERKKLNLTVKEELRNLGGKIIAQSSMARGPDGSLGFVVGWTKRESKHDQTNLNVSAQPFIPNSQD